MSDTAQIPSTEGTTVGETPLTTQETAVIQEETPVVIPPAEETPAPVSTETTPEEPVLTDEQIQAIVDELSKDISIGQATEPQFPSKQDTDIKDEVTALKVAIEKSEQSVAETQEAKAKVEELQSHVAAIREGYGNVTSFLGTEIADQIASGSYDALPAWFHEDKRSLVENHPYLGPLVAKVMAGEEIDMPALVREAAKKISLPSIVAPSAPTEVKSAQDSPASRLLNGIRARHSV